MRLMSELIRGKYSNDFEDVHSEILDQYLGVHGAPSRRQHSGAGDSDGDADHDVLNEQIAADQEHHIRHNPIDVPQHNKPFISAESEGLFCNALKDVVAVGIMPSGFGVMDSEWDEEMYPEFADIKSGRGGKLLNVCLPFVVW
jgi:hypothetical protein